MSAQVVIQHKETPQGPFRTMGPFPATSAGALMALFGAEILEDAQSVAVDALTELLHFTDGELDLEAVISTAWSHYRAEKAEGSE